MKKRYYLLILVAALAGCRERYDPPVVSSTNSFLVVEAVLNAGQETTSIRLTRSFKLDQNSTIQSEDNAQLTVEGKDNTTSFLTGMGNGNYQSANLQLIIGNEYRLRIKTNDGKEYLSDYVKAKQTPLIDSVNWVRSPAGIQIYANAQDVSNSTHYYRWEFEETWEIRSTYAPSVIYENGRIRYRNFPAEDVGTCWKYNNSSNILLANSLRLGSDIIYRQPMTFLLAGDERIGVRYSILVRQYALEAGAYDFFELLKKNTEEIGSLFNPQPSEIRGNIHCLSNPNEFVIGYVTASTIEQERIFIDHSQVPGWGFTMFCPSVMVPNNPDSIYRYFQSLGYSPYYFNNPPGDYYLGSSPECVDCTIRGGSVQRPVFW